MNLSVEPRYFNYVYSFVFVCIYVHVYGWLCACHAYLWRSGNSLCMSILSSFPHEGCKDQTVGPSWQHLAIRIPGLFVNHPPHNILSLTSFFRIHSLKSKKTPSERLSWATFCAVPPAGFLWDPSYSSNSPSFKDTVLHKELAAAVGRWQLLL